MWKMNYWKTFFDVANFEFSFQTASPQVCNYFAHMQTTNTAPNVISYGTVIHTFANNGDHQNALNYFNKMQEAAIKPNMIAFNNLISAFSKANDPGAAVLYLDKMPSFNLEADIVSFNICLNAHSKQNNLKQVLALFHRLENSTNLTPNDVSYSILINAFAKQGDALQAHNWLMKMHNSNIPKSVICCNGVLMAYCKKDYIQKAVEFYKQMEGEWGLQFNLVSDCSVPWQTSVCTGIAASFFSAETDGETAALQNPLLVRNPLLCVKFNLALPELFTAAPPNLWDLVKACRAVTFAILSNSNPASLHF